MFCLKCGTQNADGVQFCAGCGAPMLTETAQPIPPESVNPPMPEQAAVPTPEATTAPAFEQTPTYQQSVPPVQPQAFPPVQQQPIPPVPPVQVVYQVAAPPVPGKGLGIASMVVGIVSLVLFCEWIIAIPCGILGIILGAVGKSKAKAAGIQNGPALAGIICSSIGLGLAILFLVFIFFMVGMLAAEVGTYYSDFYYGGPSFYF